MTDNGIGSSLIDIQMSSAAGAAPQGARRASEGAAPAAGRAPDPEVVATAKRRRFSAGEKRQILAEAHACKKPGELGALLRRKRIYASMLSTWRRQRHWRRGARHRPLWPLCLFSRISGTAAGG